MKVGSALSSLAAAGFAFEERGGQESGVFWVMWLLVDVWSIMFQTDKMKNQGKEFYLQARQLIFGYTVCPIIQNPDKKEGD